MSPLRIMTRGFAAVEDISGPVRSVGQLSAGEKIELRMADGTAECTVEEIKKNG